MLEEIMKYKNFYQQVKANFIDNDNFFHAYIIESNDNDNYEDAVIELVKLIYSKDYADEEYDRVCNLIDNDSFTDFIKVYPDGQVIKKEQLSSVKKKFKTKSFGNKQIYVVFEADKMNKETSNTILKFLEEPSDGVVAFLVVKNRYMLLDTIISRCQVLSMDNIVQDSLEDENLLVHFFSIFTSSKNAFLNYNKILEELFVDKKQTIKILDLLEKKYYNYIGDASSNSNDPEIIKNYFVNVDKKKLVDLIEVVSSERKKLRYNVNFKLWLDSFIINFMEVK